MSFSFLLVALKKLVINLISAVFAEKFLEWVFFSVGKTIVLSTKTKMDDAGLEQLKTSYYKIKEGKNTSQKE